MKEPEQSPAADENRLLRWSIYALLIALAVGQAAGKILAVNSVNLQKVESYRIDKAVESARKQFVEEGLVGEALEERVSAALSEYKQKLELHRPFLSANDRSRWMAIRALAEEGTFEIERYLEEPTWDTIDMVQHLGRDGELHLYSSKPPFLMTLLAGPYWITIQATGKTLGTHPYEIGRGLLLIFNGGALLVLLIATASFIERLGIGDLGRIFAMACATHATMLSAFAPVLTNHLFAAAATAVACACWARLISDHERQPRLSFIAGLAAAFAAACELPALALVCLLFISLLVKRPTETLCWYLPGALLIAVAFFGTNYWAHATPYPPYAYRGATEESENWYDFQYTVNGKKRDSYLRNLKGIDRGEPSRSTYALHTLFGHHGVFSLTPVWLLSVIGMGLLLTRPGQAREFALITLVISAACLVFYIGMRPQIDRNYGGMTSGFRWLFWLAPMWTALQPAAIEWLKQNKFTMACCLLLLAFSALSASYPTWNPWTHPWIYVWLEHLGVELL